MRLFSTILFLSVTLFAMLSLSTCSLKRDNPYDVKNPNHLALTDLSIVTITASNITATGAESGGIITPPALCANATLFGICYDTVANPDITKFVVYGTGRKDSFLCTMSGINAVTSYHCRAFVVIDSVTNYGNDVVFTTSSNSAQGLPSLTTANPDLITANSARSGGSISSSGGSPISARGVCWNTNPGATINLSNMTTDGVDTGAFYSNITGLIANTKYYIRSYATNSNGTSYGNERSFTTTTSSGPSVPSLSSLTVSSVTATSAQTGGIIANDGGSAITSRGVCWSITLDPTIALSTKTTDGAGTGNFVSNIFGLTAGATYYLRAYATNSVGTAYGNQISFTTNSTLASLTTTTATSITGNTAISGGSIVNSGGLPITSRGVCWSTMQNPTVVLPTKTTDGTGLGSFISNIAGLSPGVSYYLRAYATNAIGTSYGNELTFATISSPPTVTTARVSSVNPTTAMSGGTVLSNGGSTITAYGVCWSTSVNPTVTLLTKTVDGSGLITSFSSGITGLTPGTTYHVRAYATNSLGTSYGIDRIFATPPGQIGDVWGGGKIAYIFVPGDNGYDSGICHGLIAAPYDQTTTTGIAMGPNVAFSGTTSTALGSGYLNTNQLSTFYGSGYAAFLCIHLTLGGYSDWYIPSIDELNKLYNNRSLIGGFINGSVTGKPYWSSSVYYPFGAMHCNFFCEPVDWCNTLYWSVDNAGYIRAVRSF